MTGELAVSGGGGRPASPGRADLLLRAEVEDLLAEEVHLLEDRAYAAWLQLFTLECLYWMPVDPTSRDGSARLNVFYDDRARMVDRVARLTSGSAYTEDPPSLTSRTLSALRISVDPRSDQDEISTRSSFTLTAHRRGEQRQFAGRYLHRLVRHDDGLRIREKQVVLLGSDAPQRPMTFLF